MARSRQRLPIAGASMHDHRTTANGNRHCLTRKEIAQSYKCPITLSVGDQWGDCLVLNKDQDLETLDTIVGVESTPYILMRPHDQVSLWALKLRALS